MIRKVFLNFLTVIASVLVFLVLAEIACWQIAPPPKPPFPKGMFEFHAGAWRLTPGFVGITDNRADFHDKKVTADAQGRRIVPSAPPESAHKLWLLGDSQTFGHGLSDSETWAEQLQLNLNRRGIDAAIVNLGVPAVNVDQYRARMNIILDQIKAGDQVLVGLSWNDIITPQRVERAALKVVDGYLVNAQSADSAKARILLYDVAGIALPPLQDFKTFMDGLANTSALVHVLYPRAKAIYYRYRSARPLDGILAGKVPEANFYILSEIAAMARAKGASFSVLSLPDKMFFEDRAYAVYSVGGRDFPAQNFPGHVIEPLCRKFAIRCLDAFDVLHANQNLPVAYAQDGHYNPAGARLIGDYVAESLFKP